MLTRATGGLFWSRPPQNYFRDKNDPRFELERKVGIRFSDAILMYIPPVSIGLLIILTLMLLKII